jgi:hypothetical protein
LFGALEDLAYIIRQVNSGLSDWQKFLDDITLDMGAFGPFVKSIFDSISRNLSPVVSGLEAIRGLIQWINGTSVKPRGLTFNFDGSPNLDGNRATPFAKGGIVTGPTLGLVGEAGPEAIIPLSKFDDIVGKRGGGNITINVNAGMGTDGAAVGEQIVNAIRRYERTSGAVFARA